MTQQMVWKCEQWFGGVIKEQNVFHSEEQAREFARKLAGMSYSLYLLHLPVIYVIAYWWNDNNSVELVLLGLPAAFVLSYVFSQATEGRRHVLLRMIKSHEVRLGDRTVRGTS